VKPGPQIKNKKYNSLMPRQNVKTQPSYSTYVNAKRAALRRKRAVASRRFESQSTARSSQSTQLSIGKLYYGGRLIQRYPVTGFPELLQTRLRYSFFRSFNTTNGTGQDVYQYKINSMYDCDQTGTGHQPLYRDQLYAIYKYAVVLGCRYTIEMSTTSITGIICNVQTTTYVATDSDTSTAIERGQTARAWFQLGAPRTIRGYVRTRALFGLPNDDAVLTDDLFRHDTNADPSQLGYLSIYTQDTEQQQSRVSMNVTMDFDVVWKEVVKISNS